MLHTLYHPITAMPLACRSRCVERSAAPDLMPYVRCYWQDAPESHAAGACTLVIPDTCMDILFSLDSMGRATGRFSPMQDRAFQVSGSGRRTVFAIRFYAWSAVLFAQGSLRDTRNGGFHAGIHFPLLTAALCRMLERVEGFEARCAAADRILREQCERAKSHAALMNAMYAVLAGGGAIRVSELAQHVQLSARQLERVFDGAIGVSPKTLTSMVRYQNVWRAAVSSRRFDVQDAVYRYGYTDQAHLLNQFKAYHSLTLSQALALARGTDVAFLQDAPGHAWYDAGQKEAIL